MSFARLSLFYKNFSELYSAGIDVASTIEALEQRSSGHDSQILKTVGHNLRRGRSLHHSFKVAQCVPVNDLPLVKAAEDSGRIVDVFKNLAQKHNDTHEYIKKVRMSLLKPYFTLAVALMFPGVTDLFSEKITLVQYLKSSLGVLALITAVFLLIYNYWQQSYFDIQKARTLYETLNSLPFFKKLNAKLASEKFASTLGFMLESGIDFFEALKQSGHCSANPKIQKAIDKIIPQIQNGTELQKAFQLQRVFPSDLVSAITLGSQSGKLPEFLQRYSHQLKNENESTIQTIVKIFPIAVYWLVIGQIIYSIVTFYSGYLDQALKINP